MPAAALCAPGSALAGSSSARRLQVTPAKALGSKAITVKRRTDRAPRPGRRYFLEGPDHTEDAHALASDSGSRAVEEVSGTVTALCARGSEHRQRRLVVRRRCHSSIVVTNDAEPIPRRRSRAGLFRIYNDPSSPTPTDPVGTPVKIDLLEGSAMDRARARTPGPRPARHGKADRLLPGRFRPLSDLAIRLETGSLTLGSSLPADPACTAVVRPYPGGIRIRQRDSSINLLDEGVGYLTLAFIEDPRSLIGLPGTGASGPQGDRAWSARYGPTRPGELHDDREPWRGATERGRRCAIDVTLVVKIDLSGK